MKYVSVLMAVLFLIFACEPKPEQQNDVEQQTIEPAHRSLPAVCVWDGASVRQGPSASADWITSLSLGEKLTWLGMTQPDSAKPERSYYKIMLSDSTIGWSSEYVIAQGEPGVVVSKTPVFKRPDLITMTETNLEPMSFVAVTESEGIGLEIIGNQNKPKGWVKLDAVSLQENDIAVGVIYTKLQEIEDSEERRQKLRNLITNPVFENSVFIDDLKEEWDEMDVDD
ncbi:MAG: SH3 domain-containing protein [candidate division KSB1 bacterium]|nr:SH3 domain-containing protein [candidate division KSB1 bacterium]